MPVYTEPYMKRSVRMPMRVDSALRQRAMMSGRSITQEMVSALERGLGIEESDPIVDSESTPTRSVGELAPIFEANRFLRESLERAWPCEHRVPVGQHCPDCDGSIPY